MAKKKLTSEERRRLVAELREIQRDLRDLVAQLEARRPAA
jgi:hypothetical protein